MLDNEFYEYPALFTTIDNGKSIKIEFPDLPDARADSENPEYVAMVELAMNIALKKNYGEELPPATELNEISYNKDKQALKMIRVSAKTINESVKITKLL